MRINKFFTDRGICSRREADRLVVEGRVRIHGKVAVHGDSVEEGDAITLDGKPVGRIEQKRVVIAYHKPPGIICTSDKRVRENIIDAVDYPERVFHVGRLDRYSEGLILLTNRGELVNQLLRAGNAHEKEYEVEVDRGVRDDELATMRTGIELDGRLTLPARVTRLGERGFRMILVEGRNRQIRRMCEALGLRVRRLVRVRISNIRLGRLPQGHWRTLVGTELRELEKRMKTKETGDPEARLQRTSSREKR